MAVRHKYSLAFGSIALIPLVSAVVWFGGLLAMILVWTIADDHRRYRGDEATVVFISDVGAAHKAIFIPICVVTSVFYIGALFAERALRHVDRIPGTIRRREAWWDLAAVIFGTIGAIALILLSCFDAFNHSTLHWSFTLVFIVGVGLSAICQTCEVAYLSKDHPDRAHLRRNSIYKMTVVSIAIVVAIAFGATYAVCGGDAGPGEAAHCSAVTSAAAVCEWLVAFILVLYFASLAVDLWPASKRSDRHRRREEKFARRTALHNIGVEEEMREAPVSSSAARASNDGTLVGGAEPRPKIQATGSFFHKPAWTTKA